MKKILVTGGSGCLGSAIKLVSLEAQNFTFVFPSSKELNLLDYNLTSKFLEISKPSIIIHTAAFAGSASLNQTSPVDIFENNLVMTMNLLKCASNQNIWDIFLINSIAAYPHNADNTDFTESAFHSAPASLRDQYYAYSKRMLHILGQAYSTQYNMNIYNLVVNGIYGPKMHINDGKEVMLGALINRIGRIPKDEPLVINGNPNTLREYTFSKDLANIILSLVELKPQEKLINIGNTEQHSIREYAEILSALFHRDPNNISFPDLAAEITYQRTNNDILKKLLNYKFTDLKSGLSETLNWYRNLS